MENLILIDIPTPWREPVFQRVYEQLGGALDVVYFKSNEKRRLWTFSLGSHPKTILKAFTICTGENERFFNPGIVPFLLRKRPRAAIIFTSSKDPSGWLALGLCRLLGTKIALLSDTWLGRDRDIGYLQRLARKVMFNCFGDAFVGSSRRTLEMFRHYNNHILDRQCFLSHLVADNNYFLHQISDASLHRSFDVIFSGRIVPVKNPIFFAQVCVGIKAKLGRCRALIIGDGQAGLIEQMKQIFHRHGVSGEFAGFIAHKDLPKYYALSRLLLLPTSGDCWGVVINEAMVAGTPVITTQWTAAAGELVLHGLNGYILPLDVKAWVSMATELLRDIPKWEKLSECARQTVKEFNYDRSAAGILDAFAYLNDKS